jgi:hypothetical protein
MNNYLIPANSKKSQMFLGFLTLIDAFIFGAGILVTLALLLVFKNASIGLLIVALIPLLVTSLLVMPVPNYHNVLQLITNVLTFYNRRRKYYWKGWCIYDGSK